MTLMRWLKKVQKLDCDKAEDRFLRWVGEMQKHGLFPHAQPVDEGGAVDVEMFPSIIRQAVESLKAANLEKDKAGVLQKMKANTVLDKAEILFRLSMF